MAKGNPSQCDVLLEHLRTHDHITQVEAITLYRVFNLKGRINDLRDRGWQIDTKMLVDATGKSYARYSLAYQDRRVLDRLPAEERDSFYLRRNPSVLEELTNFGSVIAH